MKPPRPDRSPSRAPAGKSYSKPYQGSPGPGGRGTEGSRGKPQGAFSHAKSAESPRNRDGARSEAQGKRFDRPAKPGFQARGERQQERHQDRPERSGRPERPERETRPPRPYGDRPQADRLSGDRSPAPAGGRVQDRAREGLTRERDAGFSPRPARSGGAMAAETPRGTVWIYGSHAAQAALANPQRRIRRLLATEEGQASLAARLPQPWSVQAETVDRARLDHLLGREAVHQGIAVLADLLPQLTIGEVLERPGPVLVLDQVTDPRNIGAILRSAAAFGVAGVILQERHAPEETGSLAKAASGALETVPLLYAVNLARTIVMLKAANCWVVGLDAEAREALHGSAFAERRVALVLGAEGEGLRRLTRESCDELTMLPMPGAMESLNVSAAAAVALYELTRKA